MMDKPVSEKIRHYIQMHQRVLNMLATESGQIEGLVCMMAGILRNAGRILVFGNGGSMADSQHFCAELVGGFRLKNGHRPAMALGTDPATLTALANDYGYDKVFALQIEALGNSGDLALGLTTSGRSTNVIEGLRRARQKGLATACLCGSVTDLVAPWSDIVVSVPSSETSHVQEAHSVILHICAMLIEADQAGENRP